MADGNQRAPSHHKPQLPTMAVIAVRLTTGETLVAIAAEYQRTTTTLGIHLNNAGYSQTGRPLHTPTVVALTLHRRPVRDESWRLEANCLDCDPDSFFPDKGGSNNIPKKVCRNCTVQTECLDNALANDERFGVWGGLSERERRKIRRDKTRTDRNPPA